jgi:hypothetical protein
MVKTATSEGTVSLLVQSESVPHNTRTNHTTYPNYHVPVTAIGFTGRIAGLQNVFWHVEDLLTGRTLTRR